MLARGRALIGHTRGAVAVIGALSLSVMIGMGAFAIEATQGYAVKASNQRIADMAALAGALAYNVNNSSSEMTATAKAVVVAQGLSASDATVALTIDNATSAKLVQVTITTNVQLSLARIFTSALSYPVTAQALATTTSTTTVTPPCIAALDGASAAAVSMGGGTVLGAPGCSINSAGGVSLSGGARITAQQVNAGKAVTIGGGASITTSPTASNIIQNKASAASDWMQDNADLKAILCQVNKLTGASDSDYADGNSACLSPLVSPNATGTQDVSLDHNPTGALATYFSGGVYTIPASYWSTYYGNKIRDLTLAGGITATLQGPLTLDIRRINMGGGTHLHFGGGNISIEGNLDVGGGSDIDFDVGVGNSITIGNVSGASINIGGGGKVCFTLNCAAPTVAAGSFSVSGNITSQGGSTIVFPKAATHVIGGNLSLSGSSTLGSGKYIIAGNFTNNTGGTMAGTDVTFAMGGTFTLSGGTSLDLAAPGSAASYGVAGILFATKSSAATSIGGGSGNKYAGLVYAPDSDMRISGGGSISTNGSACLMLIVKTLTLSGGGNISTGTCSALSTSGATANVALFR